MAKIERAPKGLVDLDRNPDILVPTKIVLRIAAKLQEERKALLAQVQEIDETLDQIGEGIERTKELYGGGDDGGETGKTDENRKGS